MNYLPDQTTNRKNILAMNYVSVGYQMWHVVSVHVSSELLLYFSNQSHEKGGTVIDLNDEHAINNSPLASHGGQTCRTMNLLVPLKEWGTKMHSVSPAIGRYAEQHAYKVYLLLCIIDDY